MKENKDVKFSDIMEVSEEEFIAYGKQIAEDLMFHSTYVSDCVQKFIPEIQDTKTIGKILAFAEAYRVTNNIHNEIENILKRKE